MGGAGGEDDVVTCLLPLQQVLTSQGVRGREHCIQYAP